VEGDAGTALAAPRHRGPLDGDASEQHADRGNGAILSGEFGGARVAHLGTDRDLGVILETFGGTLEPSRRSRAGQPPQ
jgi:hypothetical protein